MRKRLLSLQNSLAALVGILLAGATIVGCQDTPDGPEASLDSSLDSVVRVELLPAQSEVTVGDTVLFSIQVYANRGISAGDIELSFVPEYIQLVAFGDGDALGPSPIRGIDHIDNNSGSARIALARVGPSDIGSPVDTTLVTVMLEIVASPPDKQLSLNIAQVELVDGEYNILADVVTNQASLVLAP